MTAAQWRRARDLFERALEVEPAQLDSWLGREAGDDEAVRAEVASLLRHHSHAGEFLTAPVAERVPDLLEAALAGDDSRLEPGAKIGAYAIVRELGRGGMGRVYLATDTRLGRTVALKMLGPHLAGDALQRERLRREARAIATLTHPGICTIHALEEIGDDLFIVTEFIDGATLRREVESAKRPAPDALLADARELAAALASAHARSITHRDLKPENVMRTPDGRLKLVDFGLALVQGGLADQATRPQITQPGAVIGTPAYMAPEQLSGGPVDPRTDVFAFGVLMYEYATGEHPFAATSAIALAARILEGEARPIREVRPDVPPQLAEVIDRCLKKRPHDRFNSAGDLVIALSREPAAPARQAESTWWRTHQMVAIGLYALASATAWQLKEWLPDATADVVFVFISVAAMVAAVFRGHLLFAERVHDGAFGAERRRADRVTVLVDVLIALALGVDGLILTATRPLAGVLSIALAVGIALARLIVEPSTSRAAFGDQP